MRLYVKLLSMILAFAAIQHLAPPSAWGREAWFTLRCHVASVLGDEQLANNLVDEYYRNNRRIDDEMMQELECEHRLAEFETNEADEAEGDGVDDDEADQWVAAM